MIWVFLLSEWDQKRNYEVDLGNNWELITGMTWDIFSNLRLSDGKVGDE